MLSKMTLLLLRKNMKFNPLPWLCILLILCLSFWARRQLLEEQQLAFFCEAGGQSLACTAHSWLATVFYGSYAVGYVGLLLGCCAQLARSSVFGLWAAMISSTGLVLNNAEYAAAGFLLGVLALARAQFEHYRAEYGTRQ